VRYWAYPDSIISRQTLRRTTNRMADLAPVIRGIIADGRTTQPKIAAALNERRIPASRGGQWSAAQVRRVLVRMAGA
jgi:hypothetical protein